MDSFEKRRMSLNIDRQIFWWNTIFFFWKKIECKCHISNSYKNKICENRHFLPKRWDSHSSHFMEIGMFMGILIIRNFTKWTTKLSWILEINCTLDFLFKEHTLMFVNKMWMMNPLFASWQKCRKGKEKNIFLVYIGMLKLLWLPWNCKTERIWDCAI